MFVPGKQAALSRSIGYYVATYAWSSIHGALDAEHFSVYFFILACENVGISVSL